MKKTIKKSFIAVCSLAFAMSVGVGLNAVSANAEVVDVTNNFCMVDGAFIRVKGNAAPSGIRWSATVTQDYYDYITDIDANAEFGMLVDNTAIIDEATNTTEKPIICTVPPTFENEVWTYHASITYDKLQADLEELYKNDGDKDSKIADALKACYETELWARAYVKYVDGEGNEKYEYSETADVNRSIKGVAMNCLIQENTTGNADVTDDNKTAFVNYAGGNYETIDSETVTKNAYNLTSATGIITSQGDLEAGDYAVYVGAKKISDKVTHAGGKISATIAGLGTTIAIKGEENNVRFINEAGEVYQVPFVSATHIIGDQAAGVSDKTEWNNEMSYSQASANYYDTVTSDWYVAVVKDMDFGGESITKARYYHKFAGKFNGLGHTLNNFLISGSQAGLFGALTRIDGSTHGAWIQNVALTNVIVDNTAGYPIAEQVWGTGHVLKNIYVQATYTATGACQGIWRNTGTATVDNCIVNLTYTNAPATAYAFADSTNQAATFTSCYAVTNATTTLFEKEGDKNETPSENVASSMSAIFPTIVADINDEDGFGKYWSVGEYGLKFGDNEVWQNKTTLETLYLDANTNNTINLSEITGGAVEKVLQNGVEIPESDYEDGTLTCDVVSGGYTHGEENVISVYGNGKIVEQPFVVCTYVIDTYKEFDDVMQDTINAENHDSSGWYIVLGADIDANDGTKTNGLYINSASTRTFEGTFNGLGHTVANLLINGMGGIFGQLKGATIENVAFVGFSKTSGGGFIFSNYVQGTSYIKNVYVEGYSAENTPVFRGGAAVYTSNIVVNVKYGGDTPYVYYTDYTYAWATNCFAIGNFTGFHSTTNGTVSGTVYENTATFATDTNLATITTANGWNMDIWSVRNGSLYFGNRAVQDVTYTTYGQVTLS